MKRFKYNVKKLWWIEAIILLLVAHAFVACGKSGNGGVLASNPGLAGYSNTCNSFGCYNYQTGPQVSRSQGRITHDDSLDNSESAAQNRLMEMTVDINSINANGMGMGMAALNAFTYNGDVRVSGQIQVTAPIIGCNIPQGTYSVQSQGRTSVWAGTLTGLLGVNVNGGQGFMIEMQAVNLIPANFIQGGVGQQGMNATRLEGVIKIPNCENATFRIE